MFRKIIGLGALGFLLSTAQGGAQFEMDATLAPKSFLSGKDWRALNKAEQQTYAIGVVDGLELASAYGKQGIDLSWINPCVAGMSSDQITAMLRAEIDANPGDWHLLTVHQAMVRALKQSCRKKPEKGR